MLRFAVLLLGLPPSALSQLIPLPGCASLPAARAGVQTVQCDAADTIRGNQIGYTLAVPATCVTGGCGVVLDVHGYTMSANIQDHQDEMRSKGNARGMIVLQPSAPAPRGPRTGSWVPAFHHQQIIAFLRHTVALFDADRRSVHVMGYSQGGFAAWNILCLAPDLICSAAPLAASGLDPWSGAGYGDQCFSGDGPTIPRAVLYTTGQTDKLALYEYAPQQVANLQRIYGWRDEDAAVVHGRDYTQRTWTTTQGMIFSYIDHTYNIAGSRGRSLGGHCFPTAMPDPCAELRNCYRCSAEFTWSDVVLDFFEANRCAEVQPLACSSATELTALMEPINRACCGELGGDCSRGYPSTCSTECASVLLPVYEACESLLSSSREMAQLKQLLDAAVATCPAGTLGGSGH